MRAALKKPRLPFLVVVTKTDKIDANKVEGSRAQVEVRISTVGRCERTVMFMVAGPSSRSKSRCSDPCCCRSRA